MGETRIPYSGQEAFQTTSSWSQTTVNTLVFQKDDKLHTVHWRWQRNSMTFETWRIHGLDKNSMLRSKRLRKWGWLKVVSIFDVLMIKHQKDTRKTKYVSRIDLEKVPSAPPQKQKEHRKLFANLKKNHQKTLDKIAQQIHRWSLWRDRLYSLALVVRLWDQILRKLI